jgi:hypothetical protein
MGFTLPKGFGGGGGKGFFTAFVTGVPTGFVLTIFATVLFSFLISFFWTVASAFFGLIKLNQLTRTFIIQQSYHQKFFKYSIRTNNV